MTKESKQSPARNTVGRFTLPDLKICYKVAIIKLM
jgi:hypothetical protein